MPSEVSVEVFLSFRNHTCFPSHIPAPFCRMEIEWIGCVEAKAELTKIALMSKKFVNSFCFEQSDYNHDCPAACEYPSSPKQSYRQSAPKQNYCPNIS